VSVHDDSPTGLQYHMRYWSEKHNVWYWSFICDTLADVQEDERQHHESGFTRTQIFVREVALWRKYKPL
jgi:hypothetical protein